MDEMYLKIDQGFIDIDIDINIFLIFLLVPSQVCVWKKVQKGFVNELPIEMRMRM